jgi:hypothetical protein
MRIRKREEEEKKRHFNASLLPVVNCPLLASKSTCDGPVDLVLTP